MFIALLALLLQILSIGITDSATEDRSPTVNELVAEYERGCMCDECYWTECFYEAADEFEALFNSYEIKRAKNGALMIRSGNTGTYKFAKKG